MRRARVLCLMQLPPPVHGVTQINELVANSVMLRERFDIEVVPLRFADTLDELRKPSLRKLWRAARTGVQLASSVMRRRPDLAYITLAPSGLAFYRDCVFIGFLQLAGVPRIYHLHAEGIASHLRTRVGGALTRNLFRGASVVHLAPALRGDTAAVVSDDRVYYVANGIADAPVMRRARSGPPRVLFLSNMLRSKGPLTLLAAIAELAARGVPVQATFAGAPFHDGCAEELVRQIRERDLDGVVRYVGPVYGAEKRALLSDHDIFALPTTQDAFPMVLLEAMQAGLPVVATDVGAISDIVEDGETGYVVAPGAAEQLADRLEILLRDDAERARMSTRARERFDAKFTSTRFEHTLADVLASAISAARTR